MTRKKIVVLVALVLAIGVGMGATECTPQQLAVWSIAQIFGGGSINDPLAGQALSVASCESGLNPAAYNGTCCHGLFQIHYVHAWRFAAVGAPNGWGDRYNAWWNTLVAKMIYDEQGWGPWSCQP